MRTVKRIIFDVFNRVVNPIGYELKKQEADNGYSKYNFLSNFYTTLKLIGFEPKHIVDVGANHGYWTRSTLRFFPDAYYNLLEPQYWLKDSIKDILQKYNKITFHPVGAGSVEGTFDLTILNRDDSCSFRYTADEAKANGFEQIKLPVVTLNKLLPTIDSPPPDIIKIDAEGLDIEVLKGASDYFGITEIFMVEVGIVNKEFDNSFLKMITYMDNNGYSLFEITDMIRPITPAVWWLAELVFIKKNGFIDSKKYVKTFS